MVLNLQGTKTDKMIECMYCRTCILGHIQGVLMVLMLKSTFYFVPVAFKDAWLSFRKLSSNFRKLVSLFVLMTNFLKLNFRYTNKHSEIHV